MSMRRHALAALLFISASIAGPVSVGDRTVTDEDKQIGGQCSPPTCGNGRIQPLSGEVCDDGNNVNGDGCSADCRSQETCGNGIVDVAAGEQCDTSGETVTCNADCTVAFCGDGKVNPLRGESCDTAGPSDACNVFCQAPTCGNGLIEAPFEQCDDGNFVNDDGCTNQCRYSCLPL